MLILTLIRVSGGSSPGNQTTNTAQIHLRGEESIATTDEVVLLRRENDDLKKMLGETYLKYEQFKKSQNGSF